MLLNTDASNASCLTYFIGDSMDMSTYYGPPNILTNIARRNVLTYECCIEPYINIEFEFSLEKPDDVTETEIEAM